MCEITVWIEKTAAFLQASFDNGPWMKEHPLEKSYRLEHSFRVANAARLIAEGEGMDVEGLVIAGLLHDVSYSEEWGSGEEWGNHGRRSAQIARPFLESLGMEASRIQEICYGIAIHVDGKADFPGEATAFARSVSEADDVDRFDVYRIYEGMQFNRFSEKSLEEKEIWLAEKLRWVEARLAEGTATETARRMLAERLNYQKDFYSRLQEQLGKSRL